MADWTQTTHGFQVQVSTVPVSGTDATLSGITPFLRFTDTEAGHEDFRLYVDADIFQIDWLSGTGPDVWTNILKITDPTVAVPIFEFNKYTLKLANLSAVAGTKAIQLIVGVEANERWNVENTGEQNWGLGGATAPDTTLGRVAVGVLQTEMLRVLADPSVANDVSRKNYVDVQTALRVAVAGDTMTGLLTLSGNPTAGLHAATKQYVDALLPAGGAVAKSGDTMTGTLTFDFAANGVIIQSKIASEANARFRSDSAGTHEWGPGGGTAPDTGIERDSAGVLRMLTGDIFAIQVGSAAAPSLAIVGDLNTGIFSINPDILGFATAGVERIRIDATGRVGIGVTPVVHVFTVSGGGNDLALFRGTTVQPEFQSRADYIPAVDGLIFRWIFQAQDSGAVPDNFAEIRVLSRDATATSEDSSMQFYTRDAGATVVSLELIRSQVSVIAGLVGTPGLAIIGDLDTGLFSGGADLLSIAIGGAEGARLSAPADGETALLIRRNVASVFTLQRVSMGAVDSGGAGFKLLRVPN